MSYAYVTAAAVRSRRPHWLQVFDAFRLELDSQDIFWTDLASNSKTMPQGSRMIQRGSSEGKATK
jgi:hypothetical protein